LDDILGVFDGAKEGRDALVICLSLGGEA